MKRFLVIFEAGGSEVMEYPDNYDELEVRDEVSRVAPVTVVIEIDEPLYRGCKKGE